MKQHITVEQLEELNGKDFAKLRDILKMESGITEFDFNISHLLNEFYLSVGKELTIGKMIEILRNKWCCVTIELDTEGLYAIVKSCRNRKYSGEELVDALWDAVKSILLKD